MQRVLGLEETGKWTEQDRIDSGNRSADKAWEAYQKGQLQNYKSVGLGDQGLANGNVRAMERMLGLREDGYWSKEDSDAVGGLSEANAWKAYQSGLLRKLNRKVQNKVPNEGDIKSMERVLGLEEDGIWSESDKAAADGFSADTAWEAYKSGALQRWKSKGLFEHGTSNNSTEPPKSSNNTLPETEQLKADGDKFALTKQEAQRAANIIGWEYNRLAALLERYKELTRWEQSPEREAEIPKIEAVYGSVADLEARVNALREQKYYLDNTVRFDYLSENEDFDELSKENPPFVDWTYVMANNPTKARRWETAAYIHGLTPVYNALNYDNLHLLNDDERATFNYLYAKEGESAAKEYLEYLQYELNRRSSEFWNDGAADLTKKNAFTQVVGSLLSTAIALTGGKGLLDATWQNARNAVSGDYKPVDYNRDAMLPAQLTSAIRDTVAENGVLPPALYDLVMDAQDFMAVEGLSKIHPAVGVVASSVMSDTVATQAMLDAVEKGETDEQALFTGSVRGILDVLIERAKVGELLKTDQEFIKKVVEFVLNKGVDDVFNDLRFGDK